MAYSEAEKWLDEEAAEGNSVATKAIDDRPEVEAHLQFVWAAFWELGSDRPVTMGGVGAIPFSAIDRYAQRAGVDDPDQFARFLQLIRCLDAPYLAHVNKKSS
jgi:hypothetical protein